MTTADDQIPTFDELPGDVYFRNQEMSAGVWETHQHPWGQVTYVTRGFLNLQVADQTIIAMPRYAIWIPPACSHGGWAKEGATCRRFYVSSRFSAFLPKGPCCLEVSPLLKELLNEFARLDVVEPRTTRELAMAQVILDQLTAATPFHGYLPFATSARLQRILSELRADERDTRTIVQIAAAHGLTARTLDRRCLVELGMGFGNWRQRLKFIQAIEILEEGATVQDAAFRLGYATPSAFIAMFKRLSGVTPSQYRT